LFGIFLLIAVATLVAIAIIITVALIRRLYPLVAIVTPPTLVCVTVYFIRATVLAPVLLKVPMKRIVPVTQATTAVRWVEGNMTVVTFLTQVRLLNIEWHCHHLKK